ncbi:MAG: FxsA family protein [Gemmatimonadota bacterium]|nr:FxsA family protein [Gemmatimonadota bacterium]
MNVFGRLLIFFVVVPVVELLLLIRMGQVVGLWPTLLLVLGTGAAGAALARREGTRTFLAFQREMAEGRVPGRPIMDGISILVGGAFLLTPGVLTDLVGLSLLLPVTRRAIQRAVIGRIEAGLRSGSIHMVVMRTRNPF